MRPRGIPRRQAHEGATGPEPQGDLAVIPLLKDVFGRNQARWGGTGRTVATFRRSRGRLPAPGSATAPPEHGFPVPSLFNREDPNAGAPSSIPFEKSHSRWE